MKQPTIVACGVGRDSTAMLVRMRRLGWRPDAILFANVGSEREATYAFIPHLREWLKRVGFPPLTIVKYRPKFAPYCTIEGNMLMNATLPGATFNLGSCTSKFKIEPQNKWVKRWSPAKQAWAAGLKVRRLIGFEYGEDYRLKRADAKAHSGKGSKDAERYEFGYPLFDWKMDLAECIHDIQEAGLPVPIKSACFFCPNQKPDEVDTATPEDRARVILMELVAEPYNKKVHGLWRRPRKEPPRPGSITEYILERGLEFTPLEEICTKVVLNPAAKKAKVGGTHTFDPPHVGTSLRSLLLQHGHKVPDVVLSDSEPAGIRYRESVREAPPETEADNHIQLIREAI